ncbi:hypothetical protein F2P81_002398 [Scophthalmus maximus]|uniref:Uncharacterized protein n=1 Tax=Scophthalmus maximus TaxID=52904 RepID=A0A6A4TM00_SCOMX|nr:hypothetical protein F2P81_002398 [Scophthalmus maximus]
MQGLNMELKNVTDCKWAESTLYYSVDDARQLKCNISSSAATYIKTDVYLNIFFPFTNICVQSFNSSLSHMADLTSGVDTCFLHSQTIAPLSYLFKWSDSDGQRHRYTQQAVVMPRICDLYRRSHNFDPL